MLAGGKAIHLFAAIWISRFEVSVSQPHLFLYSDFESWFGPECELLGFKMDSGQTFEKRLNQEKADHPGQSLDELISHIYNWETLGSALYYQWRFLTHWNDFGTLNEKDCEWFLLLLRQLYKSSAPHKSH